MTRASLIVLAMLMLSPLPAYGQDDVRAELNRTKRELDFAEERIDSMERALLAITGSAGSALRRGDPYTQAQIIARVVSEADRHSRRSRVAGPLHDLAGQMFVRARDEASSVEQYRLAIEKYGEYLEPDSDEILDATRGLATGLAYAADLNGAIEMQADLLDLHRGRERPNRRFEQDLERMVELLVAAGRVADAEAFADELFEKQSAGRLSAFDLMHRGLFLIDCGRYDEAREHLEASLKMHQENGVHDGPAGVDVLAGLARVAAATEDADWPSRHHEVIDAADFLDEIEEPLESTSYVRYLLLVGDLDRAGKALQSMLGEQIDGRVRGWRLNEVLRLLVDLETRRDRPDVARRYEAMIVEG